ncbi:hypothetical protein AB1Y20_015734 [Prymnesium parvum]|uniref:Mediator of RNA polymerase II transcription subunit 17 n=1 Tax=Prymnesium parvum TaxID=97485 RepID=A0AB34K1M8_PRYPA
MHGRTANEEPADEVASLELEVLWVLETESVRVLHRVSTLLDRVASVLVGGNASFQPKRGKSSDEVLTVALAVDGCALRALRVQVNLPSSGTSYTALLGGGKKVSIPIAELQLVRYYVARARTLVARQLTSITASRELVSQLHRILHDASCVLLNRPWPPTTLSINEFAKTLREQLDPAPPATIEISLHTCGNPVQLCASCYHLRRTGPMHHATGERGAHVVSAHHVALPFTETEQSHFNGLAEAATLCRELLMKLDVLAEMRVEDQLNSSIAGSMVLTSLQSTEVENAEIVPQDLVLADNFDLMIPADQEETGAQSPSLMPPREASFFDHAPTSEQSLAVVAEYG